MSGRPSGENGGCKVKLFLRLSPEANERLRALTRYHGDLSHYIDQALRSADLRTLPVESIRAARVVPGLTAVVSSQANVALRTAARERQCSITALANSAVRNWLEKKG